MSAAVVDRLMALADEYAESFRTNGDEYPAQQAAAREALRAALVEALDMEVSVDDRDAD